MKLKYTAIPGVKKEVCTAEQKIAYNIAWSRGRELRKQYDALKSGFERSSFIRDAVRDLTKSFSESYPNTKYNIDAIFCCLGAGLEEYIKKGEGNRIFTGFWEIGEAFPAEYL